MLLSPSSLKTESEIHSVVSESLRPPTVLGNLQARILEWVAILFSRGSSQARDRTWVFCISGRFFTIWAFLMITLLVKNPSVMQETLIRVLGREDALEKG